MTWATIAMIVATAFDVGTTTVKLRQGCIEANPILQATHINTPLRISIYEGGFTVGAVWSLHKTHKKHPKLSKAVALVIAGSHASAGVWNLKQECK